MPFEEAAFEGAAFEGAAYRRLLRAARRSLERTGGELTGSVSVSQPDEAERVAIIGITGQYRPPGTARLSVRLADLDRAVRETAGLSLAEFLAGRDGPLRDRPAEAAAHVAGRESAVRSAEKSDLSVEAWFREWLGAVARDGTLTKLVNAGEEVRIGQAVRVLEYLAGRRGARILLPELAAAVTGDTKALNHGTVLSTLVLRALVLRAGSGRFDTAGARRELWDASDVVVDDLASRVLVLNLPAAGAGLGEWLTGAARLGVPFYVTLQQLTAMPLGIGPVLVRVCENPAVLRRAAGDLGPACGPLLCTEGRPSTAFHELAAAIVTGGGTLAYHGDFDWPGIAIAASVMARHGARPWRFGAADYLAAVRSASALSPGALSPGAPSPGALPLAGPPRPTPWDPPLADVMASTARIVFEESVAPVLIADLSR